MAEGDDGPEPGAGVEDEEQTVDANDFAAEIPAASSKRESRRGEGAGTPGLRDSGTGNRGTGLDGFFIEGPQDNSTIFGFVRM